MLASPPEDCRPRYLYSSGAAIVRGLFWYPRLGWETSLFPLLTCGKNNVPNPTGGTRIDLAQPQWAPIFEPDELKQYPNDDDVDLIVGSIHDVKETGPDEGEKLVYCYSMPGEAGSGSGTLTYFNKNFNIFDIYSTQ
ncbi:hypothetical protein AVEN_233806-1 [Araneus ventricosus]|uniref:Uncharacterized protein n=1 Tax=Araneus ventricosus TaxID=182803 RepID=A0A4Y2J3R8_ARAVE|nr:hypothetical protein AVEN_233806-1 [Araneus ventricosus]